MEIGDPEQYAGGSGAIFQHTAPAFQLTLSGLQTSTASIRLRDGSPTLELLLAVLASGLWYLQDGRPGDARLWPSLWPLVLLGVMMALTIKREGLRAFRSRPSRCPSLPL